MPTCKRLGAGVRSRNVWIDLRPFLAVETRSTTACWSRDDKHTFDTAYARETLRGPRKGTFFRLSAGTLGMQSTSTCDVAGAGTNTDTEVTR